MQAQHQAYSSLYTIIAAIVIGDFHIITVEHTTATMYLLLAQSTKVLHAHGQR